MAGEPSELREGLVAGAVAAVEVAKLAGGQPLRLKAEMLPPDVEFDWDAALSVTMAGIRAYSAVTGAEPAEAAAMMATYCAGQTAGA